MQDYEKTMRRVNMGGDASMFDDSFVTEGDATKDSIFKSEISQLLAQMQVQQPLLRRLVLIRRSADPAAKT